MFPAKSKKIKSPPRRQRRQWRQAPSLLALRWRQVGDTPATTTICRHPVATLSPPETRAVIGLSPLSPLSPPTQKSILMTDARHRFAYGDAAQRSFQMYVADMEPAMRHRLGKRAYAQLREVFVIGFEHGLNYQIETAPREKAKTD